MDEKPSEKTEEAFCVGAVGGAVGVIVESRGVSWKPIVLRRGAGGHTGLESVGAVEGAREGALFTRRATTFLLLEMSSRAGMCMASEGLARSRWRYPLTGRGRTVVSQGSARTGMEVGGGRGGTNPPSAPDTEGLPMSTLRLALVSSIPRTTRLAS